MDFDEVLILGGDQVGSNLGFNRCGFRGDQGFNQRAWDRVLIVWVPFRWGFDLVGSIPMGF